MKAENEVQERLRVSNQDSYDRQYNYRSDPLLGPAGKIIFNVLSKEANDTYHTLKTLLHKIQKECGIETIGTREERALTIHPGETLRQEHAISLFKPFQLFYNKEVTDRLYRALTHAWHFCRERQTFYAYPEFNRFHELFSTDTYSYDFIIKCIVEPIQDRSVYSLLGWCYQFGIGIARSEEMAQEYYQAAISSGSYMAENDLIVGRLSAAFDCLTLFRAAATVTENTTTTNTTSDVEMKATAAAASQASFSSSTSSNASTNSSSSSARIAALSRLRMLSTMNATNSSSSNSTTSSSSSTSSTTSNSTSISLVTPVVSDNVQSMQNILDIINEDVKNLEDLHGRNLSCPIIRYNLIKIHIFRNTKQSRERARELLSQITERDHPLLLNLLALQYETNPKMQDESRAIHYYKLAAEAGFAYAQYNLAQLYDPDSGSTINRNFNIVEAVKWYIEAAKLGDPEAQYRLGVCYQEGRGVVQSDDRSMAYFKLAAAQGNPEALYKAGMGFLWGRGVPKDEREGLKFLIAAANTNSKKISGVYAVLANCYRTGIPKILAANPRKALEYLDLGIKAEDRDAQYLCAMLNGVGGIIAKNIEESWKWMEKAACNGHTSAMYHFGVYCINSNREQAKRWFEQSRAARNIDACIKLAELCGPEEETQKHRYLKEGAELYRERTNPKLPYTDSGSIKLLTSLLPFLKDYREITIISDLRRPIDEKVLKDFLEMLEVCADRENSEHPFRLNELTIMSGVMITLPIEAFCYSLPVIALRFNGFLLDPALTFQVMKGLSDTNHQTLMMLNLNSVKFGLEGAKALSDWLKVNESLRELLITNNTEPPEIMATIIGRGLTGNKVLQKADFANSIRKASFDALLEVLNSDIVLEQLVLSHNKKISEDILRNRKTLSETNRLRNSTLKLLNVSNCKLTLEAQQVLLEALSRVEEPDAMRNTSTSSNSTSNTSTSSTSMARQSSLMELYISNNFADPFIFERLIGLGSLQKLRTDAGQLSALKGLLAHSKSLVELEFTNNCICFEECQCLNNLAAVLKMKTSLIESLKIGSDITWDVNVPSNLVVLTNAIQQNNSLTHLSFMKTPRPELNAPPLPVPAAAGAAMAAPGMAAAAVAAMMPPVVAAPAAAAMAPAAGVAAAAVPVMAPGIAAAKVVRDTQLQNLPGWAPIQQRLKQNKENQARLQSNWGGLSVVIAFMRANITNACKTSVLPLWDTISKFAEHRVHLSSTMPTQGLLSIKQRADIVDTRYVQKILNYSMDSNSNSSSSSGDNKPRQRRKRKNE